MPGQSVDHRYPLRQDAGTRRYHDHPMGIMRADVYAGLAGMLLLQQSRKLTPEFVSENRMTYTGQLEAVLAAGGLLRCIRWGDKSLE
ncbi:multicopper oxidase domain-containing protein [Nocardia flavorosea]|nr:multicopper oxidase domain-containing protein [Nocardia flavorosea]